MYRHGFGTGGTDFMAADQGRQQRAAEEMGAKAGSLSSLKRLLPFLLRYPWRLGLTLLFLVISAVTSLAIPASAGGLIDQGFVGQNLDKVTGYGLAILGISALMAVASGARFYLISVLGERVMTDLRKAVFDHLLTLDATFFDTHRVGELSARLNGDVEIIRGTIGSSLSLTLRSMLLIVGAVTMMFLTSPILASIVVIVGPLIILPIIMFTRRLRGMSRRTQDALADLFAMATETLSANRTVKAFGQEKAQSALFSRGSEASFEAETRRLLARSGLVALVMFLGTAALVVLVWWGARAVFDGVATVGQLTQFIIYALMASSALTSVAEMLGAVQMVVGATERLHEILDTRSALPVPATPLALPVPPLGTLAFERVSFAYPTRRNEGVLTDVSFTVGQGETVALVGPSGAGKSTIFALIERFYDVASGKVLVDGVDVRDVTLSDLRSRFAYVEQEPVIFAGSIAENIRFGKLDATDEEVRAAARAALVDDYVQGLSTGYDTLVGERGIMLSGGQKQRLAIARALLRDAPILLLDEATSALDAQSEALVQKALERLMQGRTTLVIAHRLATIRDADRILVLEGGRIIDQGTHEQLVRKGGRYAELARLQFRAEPVAAE
jgi:ATP-binding cassette, subfamily B, bacterial